MTQQLFIKYTTLITQEHIKWVVAIAMYCKKQFEIQYFLLLFDDFYWLYTLISSFKNQFQNFIVL